MSQKGGGRGSYLRVPEENKPAKKEEDRVEGLKNRRGLSRAAGVTRELSFVTGGL